jgi:hypothetical protein
MTITNYWPVINGSFVDFVGGGVLTPSSGVALVSDRLGNMQGSFQTNWTRYVQAPPGNYFPGTSFSVTMWLYMPVFAWDQIAVFDSCNAIRHDNIHFNVQYLQAYIDIVFNNICGIINTHTMFPIAGWFHLAVTYDITSLSGVIYVNSNVTGNSTGLPAIRNVNSISQLFRV